MIYDDPDTVGTSGNIDSDILEILRQLLSDFRSDLTDRNAFYDNFDALSAKIDDLNGNIVVLNDNVKSLSSFLVGGFSILFVLALAYALFNNLFK